MLYFYGSIFYKPPLQIIGFYWRVTNALGSSPQPTACRSPPWSLTTANRNSENFIRSRTGETSLNVIDLSCKSTFDQQNLRAFVGFAATEAANTHWLNFSWINFVEVKHSHASARRQQLRYNFNRSPVWQIRLLLLALGGT